MADPLPVDETGIECPPFVYESLFETESREAIHRADLGETTVVLIAAADDGGVVAFDDGETIARRVYDDFDHAVDVFRETVESTADEYDQRGLEYDASYSAGDFRIVFDHDSLAAQ